MVRINLLPVRAVKKRELGRQVLILMALVVFGALVVNYVWYSLRASERDQNKQRIAATQAEIQKLEKIIGEVNNITKRKKEVEDKLRVLEDLKKGRSGPVRMLDALSTAIPKKVWLKSFDELNGQVKISGSAFSNDDVAEFMHSLGTVVWTPKGIGRLVEQKRDSKTSRVELVGAAGAIEDFTTTDVASFFSNIDLKQSTQTTQAAIGSEKPVDFEIGLDAHYQI